MNSDADRVYSERRSTMVRAMARRARLDQSKAITVGVVAVLVIAIVYPLTIVFRESLQVSRDDPSFTLRWYEALFQDRLLGVLSTTAFIVLVSATLALILGALLAWFVERVDMPLPFLGGLVPLMPLLIPPVVGAVAWSFLLSPRTGYLNAVIRFLTNSSAEQGPLNIFSVPGIVFVIAIYVTPFVFTTLYPSLRAMDASLEEAANVFGATNVRTAWTVTFGLMRPAILGALVLSFVLAIAHFAIPYTLGRGQVGVLTTEIFDQLRGYPPNRGAATALSAFAVVPSLILLYVQFRLLRRGSFSTLAGRGARHTKIRSRSIRWVATTFTWSYALISSVLPLAALALVAVSPFWSGNIDVSSFTLDNFRYLFSSYPNTWSSLVTSLRLALIGATLCATLAFFISYITVRSKSRLAKMLDVVGSLPLGVPTTIFGVGFLFVFTRPPLNTYYNTLVPILVAYLVIFLPHAIRPTSAAIRQVSIELEDAARMSGTSWLGVVRRITMPLVLPSLVASWVLLFVILSREVSASVFLVSPRVNVIGVTILDLWENGQTGALAAFSLVVIGLSLVCIVVAQSTTHWQGIRRSLGR